MTVRDIARGIYDGSKTVEQAEAELAGIVATTTLSGASRQVTEDPDVPEDNDVMHLSVIRSAGKITPEEFIRLVEAMN